VRDLSECKIPRYLLHFSVYLRFETPEVVPFPSPRIEGGNPEKPSG
jgi:hypothetical protein